MKWKAALQNTYCWYQVFVIIWQCKYNISVLRLLQTCRKFFPLLCVQSHCHRMRLLAPALPLLDHYCAKHLDLSSNKLVSKQRLLSIYLYSYRCCMQKHWDSEMSTLIINNWSVIIIIVDMNLAESFSTVLRLLRVLCIDVLFSFRVKPKCIQTPSTFFTLFTLFAIV